MPLLMEMIMLVGDMAGVKYDSGMENPNKGKTRDTLIQSVRLKLQREIDKKEGMLFSDEELGKTSSEELEDDITMGDEEEVKEPKGLMVRRAQ